MVVDTKGRVWGMVYSTVMICQGLVLGIRSRLEGVADSMARV